MTREKIVERLLEQGYSNATANYYGNKLYLENYGSNKSKYSDEERGWAYERGFTAEEARILGLTEDNYKNYIGSRDYHILDPVDFLTKRLVDGKLVIEYTIGGRFPQYIPDYYCWLDDDGNMVLLEDNPISGYSDLKDYLTKLLDKVGKLAIKPLTGAGGIGFIKLEKIEGELFSNGEKIDALDEIINIIQRRFLITEYVKQCKEFDEVWKDSAAALRVIAINTVDGETHTFVSYARFGTSVSKGVCNVTSGGVAIPFDWKTGRYGDQFYRYIDYCEDNKFCLDRHPDSGVMLAGKTVPHFDRVKKLVNDVCGLLKVHTYFGFDIMVGDDDVKICEINSHPSLDYEQLMFGGLWEQDEAVQSYFREKLSRVTVDLSNIFSED